MKVRSVVVVALVLVVGVSYGAELCEFSAGEFYSRESVMACFNSIPFSLSVRRQTVDALVKTNELYPFLDIARDAPDPNLPMSVDLRTGLRDILANSYQTDLQFQDDLRRLYTLLNDAHTQYYMPDCYLSFLIRQPLPPMAFLDTDGVHKVAVSRYMSQDLIDQVQDTTGLDIRTLIGATIQAVNTVPAVDYFKNYARENIGMSKDFGTRFHLAMTQPQPDPTRDIAAVSYWQERTKRNPLPEADSVLYTLEMPDGTVTNVTLAWTFKATKSYGGYADFLADYNAAGTTAAVRSPAEVMEVRRSYVEGAVPRAAPRADRFELLSSSADVAFYALNDGQTAVLYISTMLPSEYVKSYEAINKGFTIAAERGLTQLIIDLTNNGGGDICFGRSLLAYLQGRREDEVNWGPQDLPNSAVQHNLTLAAINNKVPTTVWSPGFYQDENGNKVSNSDLAAIEPGITYTRGGHARNYSTLLHISYCGFYGYFLSPEKDFRPANVIMKTAGFCGSTCALFANHLNLYDGVRVAVAGGLPEREQQQYTSFPGLQVCDDPQLYSYYDALGMDTSPQPATGRSDLTPRRLPTTASYRICVREIYPPQIATDPTTIPMEFNFQPATYKLDDTYVTAEDPEELWYTLLPYF
mmetsp:Transcript_10773/g.30278  ORF Transcript_10773/g.30278 Transcript_10773/m.30278 type:complete len:638 (+) Transcript_10773:39-1952(+)|eukprot:CAMPEP_0119133774 /NCGR_PEP_ID=MMETSP1310-20130426/13546_1 /TAXON_ID=464262 /ORGANISM="Genus nov. species nov., Strain RCC2339" /LENGTH=637 /DNA_ID=CAMNT_0007124477 /DNA_START=36 /DNA_END=1949 /DNA_ORIENTATION=+